MSDLIKFSRVLLKWNREKNTRRMPWKGEKDPYKIWLSEIILQQTRVEQGMDYYLSFIKTFPTVHALAAAPEEKVFKLWEGLGYYSRCRNLIEAARYISKNEKGRFPASYESILALKGVGPYTAAAIASFAFNLPFAVVDGNVYRVLSRVFGITDPIDSSAGKKKFAELAATLIDKKQPGLYNQAIMDFGATICKPLPLCDQCVFRKECFAFVNKQTAALPVKEKKIRIKQRRFYFLVIDHKGETAIRQRTEKDIWQQLYEFPLIETNREETVEHILSLAEKKGWLAAKSWEMISVSPLFRQQLSHQLIAGQFIRIKLKRRALQKNDWLWLSPEKLDRYAFPRLINRFKAGNRAAVLF